jgi:hypothetical protein
MPTFVSNLLRMKKVLTITLVTLFSCFLLVSCDKLKSALLNAFSANSADFTFTVPPVTITDSVISLGSQTIYFDLDSTIKAVTSNSFNLSTISSVTPNSITLKIQNADSANSFANFQSGTVSFYSNTNTTPYNFNFTNPDHYTDSISIPVDTNTNLKSYLEGKNFNYSLMGKTRRVTNKQLMIKANVKFKVH